MRRLAPIALLFALLLPALAAAQPAPTIDVTPQRGSQFQTFVVTGAGFQPGAAYWPLFTSPDGDEFGYYGENNNGTVTANQNGRLRLTVVPAVDFAGGRAGAWTVTLCAFEGGECWSKGFNVSR